MLRCSLVLLTVLSLAACAHVETAFMRACGISGTRVTESAVNSCVGTGTHGGRPHAFPLVTVQF